MNVKMININGCRSGELGYHSWIMFHKGSIGFQAFIEINNREFIMKADFNLSQLPLIRIAAARTGFGKANLTVNGIAGGIVPIRRDRIYLFVRALVNTTGRDYETDELILIPSETNLRGLMTTVDGDGARSTRTVVTTSMKIRVSE